MWSERGQRRSWRQRKLPHRCYGNEAGAFHSAVAEGFEPSVRGCRTRHFECLTFGRSDTLPCVYTRSTIPDAEFNPKLAFGREKLSQQGTAFILKYSADDFRLMV